MKGHSNPVRHEGTMRRLILLRHGKTEAMAASGDDCDRALLPRGQADAALMAKVLLEEGLKPDLALVSAAVRARQTWDVAKSVFGDVKTEIVPTLYLAPSERMRDLIDEWADRADTMIIVGHNPGIHELAVALLREGSASASQIAKLQQGFPTATAAVSLVSAVLTTSSLVASSCVTPATLAACAFVMLFTIRKLISSTRFT